jgi:hypothetical protein
MIGFVARNIQFSTYVGRDSRRLNSPKLSAIAGVGGIQGRNNWIRSVTAQTAFDARRKSLHIKFYF